jgi:alpha-L-rhamnosidase
MPEAGRSTAVELSSGEYHWRYIPESAKTPILNFDTPISEFHKYPKALQILREEFPRLTDMMLFKMMAGERSLNDFVKEGFIKADDVRMEELSRKMSENLA